ncbi:SDR family oxidoreductase [Streptomyces sp. NBC_01622]|uniref:SDR family NAD(P)-dependent oxidoreductase n=1 Tax=Streptomyces sp. NBC_01622 TaxID=2975903 RepID=UPI00386B43E5|nr:SDR family oxidoreductase [Streptomyces sp. NBC_01622]
MANRLDGKVAVVTGAASGIGAATARVLVSEGARVVLGDINDGALDKLVVELGDSAVGLHADVSREEGVRSLVRAALDSFGRLDVLDNNAAVEIPEDTGSSTSSDEAWQRTFDVTVMAAVWGARHAIPAMLASDGGGSIVNISSGAVRYATATKAAYGACKSALETFSLYIGAQHGADGIRSNVVRPGFVLTEGVREIFDEEQRQRFADMLALGRVCQPEDVAETVAFLASPAAGYVNCAVLDVDGGGSKPMVSW